MAYWQGQFKSKLGHTYTCSIYDGNLASNKTFTFGPEAAVLSYERGDNKYMPYKAIMCTMDIVTEDDMSTMYSDVPMRNGVTITDEQGVVWFDGYLIPSEWSNDARPGLKRITVNATDALGMLKYNKLTSAMRYNTTISSMWEYIMESMNIDDYVNNIGDEGSISSEIFMPENHDEPPYSSAWGTYEDVINAIGTFTNYTTMIWKGMAYIVNVDTYSGSYWQSSIYNSALNYLQDDNFNVEITPSYSHLRFSPSGGRKVMINDIFKGIDVNQCISKSTTSSKTEDDKQHCQITVVSQASPSSASKDFNIVSPSDTESNLLLLRSWGEGAAPGGEPMPIITGSINLKANARHTIFDGQPIYIKCSIMIDSYFPWVESELESTEQSGDDETKVLGSHIGLKVAGFTIYPDYVQNLRPDGAIGFYEVIYRFGNMPYGGLVEPVIIPQEKPIYIRSIEVISLSENEYGAYNSNYQELVQINTGFDRILDVNMPIMVGRNHEVSAEYRAYVRSGNPELFVRKINSLRSQYQSPRRLYKATLPLAGFNPFYKVNIGASSSLSRKCTIDGARIMLRDDVVSAELLESGN